MNTIFKISGYQTSRNYEALADMMQRQSIICIVDYMGSRDVAKTLWSPAHEGSQMFQISTRGISYITALSRAEFIRQCARDNVEFLLPSN